MGIYYYQTINGFVVFALEGVTVCSYQINKNNKNEILRFSFLAIDLTKDQIQCTHNTTIIEDVETSADQRWANA